jgi:hypothetical protein
MDSSQFIYSDLDDEIEPPPSYGETIAEISGSE